MEPEHDMAAREKPVGGGVLKPSEVLEKAADLITPAGAWTQFMRARDAQDRWVEAISPRAVCWCVVGAIQRAAQRPGEDDPGGIDPYRAPEVQWLAKSARIREVAVWNDASSRTQAEVVAALRKASVLAEKEEAMTGANPDPSDPHTQVQGGPT